MKKYTKMSSMRKIFCFGFLFFLLIRVPLYSFDLSSLLGDVVGGKDRGAVGLLLTDIEHRKKQLENLENDKKVFKQRAEETIKSTNNIINDLKQEISETREKIKGASGSYEELLKEKLALLNDRNQNLVNFIDMWKEVDGKIENHIKLTKEIIEALKSDPKKEEKKVFYSWKDLDETKGKIDQLAGKIVSEEAQKDLLRGSVATWAKKINSLKKEIDLKVSEKEKIAKELEGLSEREEGLAFISEIKERVDVVENSIDLLKEKIDVAEFKKEDFLREERYKKDEIFLLKQRLKKLNDHILVIQKRLVIDISDVEFSKGEIAKAKKIADREIADIARKKRILRAKRDGKGEKDGLVRSIKFILEEIEKLKKSGELKTVAGYLLKSRLLLFENEKNHVDREIDYWDTQKERLDAKILSKEIKGQIIEILHELRFKKDKVGDWLAEFRGKMRAAEHTRKILNDKRIENTNFLSSINKKREELLSRKNEIEALQREQGFFGKNLREYAEILNNIKKASEELNRQKVAVERCFSQVTEFLVAQEDIINQYNFIIKYLESQKAEGIWKRSSRAVSIEQLWKSVFEAEALFGGLFWDVPAYLGPLSIFNSVKSFTFEDYVGVAIFFVLYLLLFIVSKLLLFFFLQLSRRLMRKSHSRPQYVFAAGVEHIIKFVLKHFTLIYTWKLFFTHVLFGLTYFKPLANKFGITVFYFLTIPVLIYLSNRFIYSLKILNQQLQYLFVSEKLQLKTTVLSKIFLYATAIILPLRRMFLVYFDREMAFSEVSLAAYTLILVVIILFFFDKDDLLRLLSGSNKIILFLRRKVDRYYYPVFGFFMFLLILSNPYIGYSNLAWYLAFAVPVSISLCYGLFILHFFLRKYSIFLFIKEEDDEITSKFEHAKAYYGLFIAITFIVFAVAALVLLARLWGIEGFTLGELWKKLSEEWVIRGAGPDDKLGLIELGKLGIFITAGLFISSFIKRFVLIKLFDIFKTEPGVQNTVSKILHYLVIILALILGFTAINLSQYALTVGTLLLVGVGFGMRDQIADYFAGILVLLERPIEIGHFVETGEFKGKVHRISARSTTLKTARNFFITIPNRDLISKPIVNWGQGRYAVGCELQIMVSFNSDPDKVKKVMLAVMKDHSMVLRVPAPIVRFEGFEASALYFYCRCYVSARRVLDMWELASDLRFAVMRAFKENEIVIPYPQTVVHFAKTCKKEHAGSDVQGANPSSKEGPQEGLPIKIKFDEPKE